MNNNHQAIQDLRRAYRDGNLNLYLGAGVSIPSGLPTWEALVQSLYFSVLISEQYIYDFGPYPNYLYAASEWMLKRRNEPLDIVVRKISTWYQQKPEFFFDMIKKSLYSNFEELKKLYRGNSLADEIMESNKTLEMIVRLLKRSTGNGQGVREVISYNYDNLVEIGMKHQHAENKVQPIWKKGQRTTIGKIPVFHVHGFIPFEGLPSVEHDKVLFEEIIFSEEQYNSIFTDNQYWANQVQTQSLASGVGLMIGLSLSDRNMRRLLDSIREGPRATTNYVILKKPSYAQLNDTSAEIAEIKSKAREYSTRLANSGIKAPDKEMRQIVQLMNLIFQYDESEFHKGYESLGLKILLINDFEEIPEILDGIAS